MRVLLALALVASAVAFAPAISKTQGTTTKLEVARRDVLLTAAGILAAPAIAQASGSTFFFDENIENVREPSQMHTGGKIDLNSAFVGEYKQLPGMFPHAAGKIASNGPYNSVADIYKIPGLTANDKKLYKQYEKYFTTNPPGRSFDERINSRVST